LVKLLVLNRKESNYDYLGIKKGFDEIQSLFLFPILSTTSFPGTNMLRPYHLNRNSRIHVIKLRQLNLIS
ncbi:MAG: hypothetical protein ACN6PN_14140, partial [Sphingobacterium sp.]